MDKHFKNWVQMWKKASSVLDKIRKEELKQISTQQSLINLAQAFESARLKNPLRPSSGLVEQQALFKKWHNKGIKW